VALALVGLALTMGGCSGSPFVSEAPVRSPYERYDILRGTARPATTIDSFGREQPALRARLAPRDPA